MDLNEFNVRVLGSLNIIDDGEGYLSRVVDTEDGESTTPFTVNGKRVILPTGDNLRKPPKETIVYHPLSENITRGESDMIKALRDTIMYELTMRSITLITELARVAATPSEHKRLDGPSGKYLQQVQGLDERVYLFLRDKLVMRIGPEPENRLISLSLSKGNNKTSAGVLRSVKFRFPILDVLMSKEMTIMGVKFPSQKARNVLRTLFEIVLGDEQTREGFDYGSKNLTAPYFHALMSGFANFATHFNKVVKAHKKLLGKELAESLTLDLTWVEGMDQLADLRKVVPPQAGNEGSIILSGKDPKEATKEVAAKLLPADRRADLRRATETDTVDEEEPLPWEDEEEAQERRRTRTGSRPAPKAGKTLDDFLEDRGRGSRSRRDRYEDDRYSRRDRYRDDDRRDRGRDRYDDRRAPDFDLGLDSGRQRDSRRDYRDRDYRDRDFGRGHDSRRRDYDDRGDDRRGREFGAGHRNSGYF